MDIGLPDIDGYDVCREMRQYEVMRGYSPIVGLTGYNSKEDNDRAALAGMDDMLIKPVKPEELAVAMNKCIGTRFKMKF